MKRTLLLPSLLAVGGLLVACGSDDDTDSAAVYLHQDAQTDAAVAQTDEDADMVSRTGVEAARMDAPTPFADGTVRVVIDNVLPGQGDVYAVLQTEDQFGEAEGAYREVVSASDPRVIVTFEDVEPGSYAVAVFQDTDSDGDLTMGETGPAEPWGFSGEQQRGAPDFAPSRVIVTKAGATANVSLSS